MAVPPPKPKVKHYPICGTCRAPWPCPHYQEQGRFRAHQYYSTLCLGCGKPRNAWASLDIERDLAGRRVYFHARKKCSAKAKEWWDKNVKPHIDEEYHDNRYNDVVIGGLHIGDLRRHIHFRGGSLKAVNNE